VAQQFTLKLANPALAQTQSPNEIYTGLQGGNKLDLILTNLSGFDTSFAPSNGGDLLVKFPASILDEAAAQKITVAAPWTLDGIDTHATDPDMGANQADYVLKLKPPPDPGVAFQANASVTVSLANIEPTAKGNATIVGACQFTDLGMSMDANDQLAVLGAANPDNEPLIGDGSALRLTVKVNDGPATNAIVVTSQPVTAQNAAENRIQLNFDFQDQSMPGGTQTNAELGQLVPKWDPLKPPTFRVQFPYYGSTGEFAAPQDLTDDRLKDDPNYNNYTSAWNIKLSFSRTDPDNTQNPWWTIKLDPKSKVPSWLIQPTQQNKYLFTGTNQGPNAPGPFLDLFFSHIYSDLPIDASKPETILFLTTCDFPGFNDRRQQQPIFKEPSVQICSFSGSVTTKGGVTTLKLSWETENADHCLISGDANKYDPVSVDAFSRTIDLTNTLKSSYTLTAVGTDGVSKLQRTIDVRWTQGTRISTNRFQNPTAIDLSPDGKSIYLVGDNALNVLDCKTLLLQGNPLSLPDGSMITNVAATPDGSTLFLAAMPFSGGGSILAYTSTLQPIATISSAEPGTNDSPNLYPMAISGDGSQLAISMPYPGDPGAQPSIIGYSAADLTYLPSGGSPAQVPSLRQMGLAIDGDNLYYPDSGGLGVLDRTTFKPRPGSPVSLKSSDEVSYTPGPLAVSPDGSRVATLARGIINNKRAFILCLVDVNAMQLVKRVQVGTGYSDAPPVPTTGMSYSLDGEYLFVFGTNYATDPPQPESTVLGVYDADSLQELEWSPIPVTRFYGNFVMAPDGSRFYVSTYDTGTATMGSVIELVPYLSGTSG
jgi:hypothetical protein